MHGDGCGHPRVAHGDHFDYVVNNFLHHVHGEHCDHHGEVEVRAKAALTRVAQCRPTGGGGGEGGHYPRVCRGRVADLAASLKGPRCPRGRGRMHAPHCAGGKPPAGGS